MKYLGLTIAVWFVAALLKFSGFCFSQPGWISNRELIEAAFAYDMKRGAGRRPAIDDVAAYLKQYPRCCSVSGSPMLGDGPLVQAITLRRFYEVSITYPVTDPALNDGDPYYQSLLTMDCCGATALEVSGTGQARPVPPGPAPPRPPRTIGPQY